MVNHMKTNAPLVSVIVPVYNTEKYLDKCIDSICRQTYKNLEIILINDGSSDNSLDICMKHQEKDSRIKIFSQKNKGLIETRKFGVSRAKGKLIGFVDSDDWIEKDMYSHLSKIAVDTNADLISSGIIHDYEAIKGCNGYDGIFVFDNYAEGFYSDLEKYIYPTMLHDESIHNFGLNCNLVNKLFKKELLQNAYQNLNSDIFYGEDCLAAYTYCLLAKSIYISKSAFYHYNIRTDSMCSRNDAKLLYNSYLLYSELKNLFFNHKNYYVLMRQLKKYILRLEFHNLEKLYNINVSSLGAWHFAHVDNIKDSKIIIYGAGGCGQAFYQYVRTHNMEKQVVAWVDKNPSEKSEQCMYKIESPEILSRVHFDYVIIAVLREVIAEGIKKDLCEHYNIEKEKIIWNEPMYTPFLI